MKHDSRSLKLGRNETLRHSKKDMKHTLCELGHTSSEIESHIQELLRILNHLREGKKKRIRQIGRCMDTHTHTETEREKDRQVVREKEQI